MTHELESKAKAEFERCQTVASTATHTLVSFPLYRTLIRGVDIGG